MASKIFIASSTEGNAASKEIGKELKAHVNHKFEVHHWTTEFKLSLAYIESLEQIINDYEFGIFVLTADDVVNHRNDESKAPRDNVVFELGLFMGALGRSRCFIFVEVSEDKLVKSPSDLFGIEKVEFSKPPDGNWKGIFTESCKKVISQISFVEKLFRVPDDVNKYVNFIKRIQGYWWDKVNSVTSPSIGFKTITPDKVYNSIKLEGDSFSAEGKLMSHFINEFSSVVPDHKQVIYYWRGFHPTEANIRWSGYGDLTFNREDPSGNFIECLGKFFNINEFRTNKWEAKTTKGKRETDTAIIDAMLNGSEKQKADIIKEIYKSW